MKNYCLLVILVVFIFSQSAYSQTTQWLNDLGPKTGTNFNTAVTDEWENSYQFNLVSDTFEYRNKIYGYNGSRSVVLLVKRNANGKELWRKKLKSGANTTFTSIYSTISDRKKNFYSVGFFDGDSFFIDEKGYKKSSNSYQMIVMKFDTSGGLLWHRSFNAGKGGFYFNTENMLALNLTGNELAISIGFSDTLYFQNRSTFLVNTLNKNNNTQAIIELTTNGNLNFMHQLAARKLGSTSGYNFYALAYFKNRIHTIFAPTDSFRFNAQNFQPGYYFYTLKKNGSLDKIKNYSNFKLGYSYYFGITSNKNYLFVTGTYEDTMNFGKKKYQINYSNSNQIFLRPFLVALDSNLNEVWIKLSSNESKNLFAPIIPQGNAIVCTEEFVYVNYRYFLDSLKSIKFLDKQIVPSIRSLLFQEYGDIIAKIDMKGNVLWNFSNRDTAYQVVTQHIDVFPNGDLILSGFYNDYIKIFNDSLTRPGSRRYSPFTARINDYRIVRGPVAKGPYCAGDSFALRYKAQGLYGKNNVFTAELSDENGEFDDSTTYFKLGSIKAVQDSVIQCKFPKSQLNTSGNYRIRVVSNSPKVQSFYKIDTLRILIYSRDTANLGADTTICLGQQITLSTFGGTAWNWSPKIETIAEKGSRLTIKPTQSRMYKVRISDSSGCGVTDEDSILVAVRNPLKITSSNFYSQCLGGAMKLQPIATGGKSSQYQFIYQRDSNNRWVSIANNLYKPRSNQRIRIILTDNCTPKNDTQILQLKIDSTFTTKFSGDTVLCQSQTGKYKIVPTACTGPFGFKWLFLSNNQYSNLNNSSDSLIHSISASGYIVVQTLDSLSMQSKRDSIYVRLRNPLRTKNILDTIVCFGTQIQKNTLVQGGKFPYTTSWYSAKNKILKSTSTIVSKITAKDTFYITVSDACSPNYYDTFVVDLGTFPNIDFSIDTQYCYNKNITLIPSIVGSVPPFVTRWKWNNSLIATSQNTSLTLNNAGKNTLEFSFKEACIDSTFVIKKSFSVLPPIQTNQLRDTTLCDGVNANLTTTISGGLGSFTVLWKNTSNNFIQPGLNYTFTPILNNNPIQRIVSDNCSPSDTQNVIIRKLLPLNLLFLGDTSICAGTDANWEVQPTGGNGNYTFTWQKLNDNTIVANSAKLSLKNNFVSAAYSISVSDNCTIKIAEIKKNLIVNPFAIANFSATPTIGCEPLRVDFANNSREANLFYLNKIPVAFPLNKTYMEGTENLEFVASNPAGCNDTQVISLTIYPKPSAGFTYGPDFPIFNEKIRFVSNSNSSLNHAWFRADSFIGNPQNWEMEVKDTLLSPFKLIVTNNFGCSDTVTKKIKFNNPFIYWVPTAFSPNGDGLNDVFAPRVLGSKEYKIEIFNRWGQKLWQGKENEPFTGKINNENLPNGVYAYRITIASLKGIKKYQTGTITLIE